MEADGPHGWGGPLPRRGRVADRRIAVRATEATGRQGLDVIEPATEPSSIPTSRGIGSDADTVGAWPERGLLGMQLGPNRNGRHW